MNASLPVTIVIEALAVLGYAAWRKKPAGRLVAASVLVNVITQSLLWLALNLFARQYLTTLLAAEAIIWPVEAGWLYFFPGTQLAWKEALLLSLGMNLASFGLGWFLPV